MPVGVIGVGNMGLPIALRLLDNAYSVQVRDIDGRREALARRAGAAIATTPAALGSLCALVIVVVVDGTQVEQVLFGTDGVVTANPAPATVLLCPTIAPAEVESAAGRLLEHGIGCIDAPMSGGPARARSGQMSLMVACDDKLFARHEALLRRLASGLFRVGTRPGDGARTKLVNNLLAAVNLAAAAEALALARRVGLNAAQTQAVIEQSSGQSWIGSDRMRRALADDMAPLAHTRLLAKDSCLAIEMARTAGVEPELGRVAANLFAQACAQGFSAQDDASLLKFVWHRQAARPGML
jgi:3-hydroxyisobutyrate dehydrogenase